MKFNINDIAYEIKGITLGQYLDYYSKYGAWIEEEAAAIFALKDSEEKEYRNKEFLIDRACTIIGHFIDLDPKVLKESVYIEEVLTIYQMEFGFLIYPDYSVFYSDSYKWNGETWLLQSFELNSKSTMTFGQFIDSKVAVQENHLAGLNRWEVLPTICAIFLEKVIYEEPKSFALFKKKKRSNYNRSIIEGDMPERMKGLPLEIALGVLFFFDKLNDTTGEFDVFRKSRLKSGKNIKEHFKYYGWINFLTSLARTKVFDLPNMNSIDSVREAPAFDVLLFASEDKMLNEAMALDQEEEIDKNR